jgi:hypothetical protein
LQDQVCPLPQALLFKIEDHFFAVIPKLAIDEIPLSRIELPHCR